MKNRGVLTSYKIGDKKFSSYILGKSISEIRNKIDLRGLDETIDSSLQSVETMQNFHNLNDYEFLMQLPTILHTACFLSFIALKSRSVSVEEVIGDEGVIHELTHLMTATIPITDGSIKETREKLRLLQQKIIGAY